MAGAWVEYRCQVVPPSAVRRTAAGAPGTSPTHTVAVGHESAVTGAPTTPGPRLAQVVPPLWLTNAVARESVARQVVDVSQATAAIAPFVGMVTAVIAPSTIFVPLLVVDSATQVPATGHVSAV